MNHGGVCAIVYGVPEDPLMRDVLVAVGRQSRPPDTVITGQAGLRAALAAAGSVDAEWVWLLDGGAVPAPDALEALLDRTGGRPEPVLLCSKVLGPEGGLDPGSLPRHVIYATDVSVSAAEARLIQLRAAGSGSVLIRRRGLPPGRVGRSDLDMVELSAQVLRDPSQIGYLVPGSLATRRRPLEAADLGSRVRSLAGSAWTPREKLREALRLTRPVSGLATSARRAGRGR